MALLERNACDDSRKTKHIRSNIIKQQKQEEIFYITYCPTEVMLTDLTTSLQKFAIQTHKKDLNLCDGETPEIK